MKKDELKQDATYHKLAGNIVEELESSALAEIIQYVEDNMKQNNVLVINLHELCSEQKELEPKLSAIWDSIKGTQWRVDESRKQRYVVPLTSDNTELVATLIEAHGTHVDLDTLKVILREHP